MKTQVKKAYAAYVAAEASSKASARLNPNGDAARLAALAAAAAYAAFHAVNVKAKAEAARKK